MKRRVPKLHSPKINDYEAEEKKSKGIGKPPSAKDSAEVMQMFREVNGDPAPKADAKQSQLNAGMNVGGPSAGGADGRP